VVGQALTASIGLSVARNEGEGSTGLWSRRGLSISRRFRDTIPALWSPLPLIAPVNDTVGKRVYPRRLSRRWRCWSAFGAIRPNQPLSSRSPHRRSTWLGTAAGMASAV